MTDPGWTVNTLKEHFDDVIRLQDKAVTIALASAEKAVTVAEGNAEKWRQNANEWRGAMSDKDRNYVTKNTLWGYVTAIVMMVIAALALSVQFIHK